MSSTADLIGLGLPPALAERIGYTTYNGNPTNNVTPKFIGQVVFDTANSNWYKSTGTAAANWKAMTS